MKHLIATTALLFCFHLLFAQTSVPFQDDDEAWGLKDEKGNIVLEPMYDVMGEFSEGLAYVMLKDKAGYINAKGKVVIPLQFDIAYSFSNGLAAVSNGGDWTFDIYEGGHWGFIDRTGKMVVPLRYDKVADFVNGFAPVSIGGKTSFLAGYIDGKWGFINKAGKEITPLKYDDIHNFKNGYGIVNTGYKWDDVNEVNASEGKWGYIDSTGKAITAIIYDDAYGFYDDRAIVVNSGKRGLINRQGKEVVKPKYDAIDLSSTEPNFARVFMGSHYDTTFQQHVGGKQGYIDNNGKEITPIDFSVTWDFNEGLAPVNRGAVWSDENGYQGGKWGFIDKTGKLVIPLRYESAGYFFAGVSKVKLDGRDITIDKTGKEISK